MMTVRASLTTGWEVVSWPVMTKPQSHLARALRALGLSMSDAARRAKCDPSYVAHIIAGRLRPGLRVAAALEELTRDAPCGPVPASSWAKVRPTGTGTTRQRREATP